MNIIQKAAGNGGTRTAAVAGAAAWNGRMIRAASAVAAVGQTAEMKDRPLQKDGSASRNKKTTRLLNDNKNKNSLSVTKICAQPQARQLQTGTKEESNANLR